MVDIATKEYGLLTPLPSMGPHPLSDTFGMEPAIIILRKSLDPGKYSLTNVQFSTARKMRSAYSNLWGASVHTDLIAVIAKERS